MYDLLTSPGATLFSIALAIVIGLFVLELLSAFLGSSILGVGTDAPDVDMDADFDMTVELESEVGMGVEGAEATGLFTWIGARDVPFLIWLVSFLTMFGLFGLILQSLSTGLTGSQLPSTLAVVLVFVPALGITRVIANWVALLMPKTLTTAIRTRHLGGHHGVITQGTAERGKPAEVKIRDRHGNFHYLRVEPLHDDAQFPQGSYVTLIRKRGDKFFVI